MLLSEGMMNGLAAAAAPAGVAAGVVAAAAAAVPQPPAAAPVLQQPPVQQPQQPQQPQQQQNAGVLKVLTFTGTQPFVVRCERDTRVKDIVGAIAEIWGFKEAARLFTLCRPAPQQPSPAAAASGTDGTAAAAAAADPSALLPGTLLSWNDKPCQAAAADPASADATAAPTADGAAATNLAPLLLVRYIFGSTPLEWDQNHSVLSLTAAQIAADVAATRYPAVAEAGLYQHWVKQGQHSVVLHMAASWPSGSCLIVGPAQVLSGGAALQLGNAAINIGLNSKGLHIMTPQQHKVLLPLESVARATPAGDVLNVSFVSGQPDLVLQLPGAEAVAEAFKVHKEAAAPATMLLPLQHSTIAANAGGPAAVAGTASGPASGQQAQQGAAGAAAAASAASAAAAVPFCITSPSVERWLSEGPAKAAADAQPLSVAIQVRRPWEQTPPALRVSLTTEQAPADERLVEAQLLVVDDDEAEEGPRVRLQLRVLPQPPVQPEPRVTLTITPVPEAEQEAMMPAPGEEPLVRLVLRPRAELGAAGSSSPAKGVAGAGAGVPDDSTDGMVLRNSMLGIAGGAGVGGVGTDERPHPQLMQHLQQQAQQQQEVRQGLMAGTHLAGTMTGGQLGFGASAGMRPAFGAPRPGFAGAAGGFRPGMQQAGVGMAGWAQQQQFNQGGMRPAGMRPLGGGGLPHQPYTLVGPPLLQQQGMGPGPQRPGMGPMGGMGMGVQAMQARGMRPQQQQFGGGMGLMQQQFAMRQAQPQMVMQQQGGFMVMQQQPQMLQQGMMMQQQPQMAFAMPQQQQQPQQQVMMLSHNSGVSSGNMVLINTADGRQLLVPESQLQTQQQPQMQQPGVFMLGPHGELISQGVDPNAGMQQVVLQQQQQPMTMGQQQQQQPIYMQQPTPSQKLQQQFQAQQQAQQQMQAVYQQQQQPQPQMQQMQFQLQMGGGGMSQPQQQLVQAQPMAFMDLNSGQLLQAQQQPQQQQQFAAASSAQVGSQLLQLQGKAGAGQGGFVLQGQQQQQPQQQQVLMQGGAPGLVDSSGMGQLLQQAQMPRRSNGTNNMVMTSGAMFGGPGAAPGSGLVNSQSGPSSTGAGGIAGLGLLQQQGLGGAAPGLQGIGGLSDGSALNNAGLGGLGAPGSGFLGSFDPLRQPNSHSSLDNSGLGGVVGAAGAGGGGGAGAGGAPTADPPGLNFGGAVQKPAAAPQQQQMFSLGNAGGAGGAGIGGLTGLGGMQVHGGLQGGVLGATADGGGGFMLTQDGGMGGLTGAAPGLDVGGFATANQQFNTTTPSFY